MVSSRSIQQQTEGESTNQIVVNNENQNQGVTQSFVDSMKEKNIAAAFATSLSISLFIAAFVDPCILSIYGVSQDGCPVNCIGFFSKSNRDCAETGQLFAVYATLLICLALILECISFILESAGFTHPSLLRLFKRYGVLHFCAVLFIIISAGLWYGYSEHLETTLEKYPKARGSKVIIDFSRAYWYIVVAAVSALFGAALNVLRIYDDSIDEDQQRLIPEEMRHSYFIITRPPDNPQPPPYALCE